MLFGALFYLIDISQINGSRFGIQIATSLVGKQNRNGPRASQE
jgi:hypothetical protein